ncbi:MAG TPA: glycosyl hydrolase family 28-related protein [Chthoniobacterales bacterium]|nr:glycosyl hydrolase family 28-related protein [Chthoniobacterales bacterium]
MEFIVIMDTRLFPAFLLLLSTSIALSNGPTPNKKPKPGPTPLPTAIPGAPVYFNVLDFGALTNSADNSASIQAAINAANPNGIVYFPDGNYNIASSIVVGDGTGNSHVSMFGQSPGGVEIRYSSASATGVALKFNMNSDGEFRNISFVNNVGTRGTTEGIQFTGPSSPGPGTVNYNNTFYSCSFYNFHYGFHTSDTNSNTGSECTFLNCTFTGNDVGFLNDDPNGLDFTFVQLQIASNSIAGIKNCSGGGGVAILSGSASVNTLDFYLCGANTGVSSFRSEGAGEFVEFHGTTLSITNCDAEAISGTHAIETYGNSAVQINGSRLAAPICVYGAGHITLTDVHIQDTVPIEIATDSAGGGSRYYAFQGVALVNRYDVIQSYWPDSNGLFTAGTGDPGTFHPFVAPKTVVAKTSSYAIDGTADANVTFTNSGASGEVDFTLPPAAANLTASFHVDSAQTLKIIAGAGSTIQVADMTSSAGGNIANAAQGSHIVLQAISSTKWVAESVVGTWAAN